MVPGGCLLGAEVEAVVVVEDGDGLDLGEVSGHGGVALANEVGVVEVGVTEETEVAVLLAVEVEGDAVAAYEERILADAAGLVTSYSSPEKKQIRIYLYDASEYYILYITCIIVGSARKFYYLIINSVSTIVKCYCSKIVNLFSKMTSKKLPIQILLAQYFQNRKKKKGGKNNYLLQTGLHLTQSTWQDLGQEAGHWNLIPLQ